MSFLRQSLSAVLRVPNQGAREGRPGRTLRGGSVPVRLGMAVIATLPGLVLAAPPHDYPTLDRVRFVQECMRDHPGPHFEMTSKCVCTIDKIAMELTAEEFVNGATIANANSIGGERGNEIRDTEMLQTEAKRYRSVVAKAKNSCFINVPTPR